MKSVTNNYLDKLLEFSAMRSMFKLLSKTEYLIISMLISKESESDHGRIYLETIKNEVDMPMSQISKIVKLMSEEGLTSWNLDSENKKTYVMITDEGRDKYLKQKKGLEKINKRLTEEASEEAKAGFLEFVNLCEDIIDEEKENMKIYFELIMGRSEEHINILSLLTPKKEVKYLKSECSIRDAMDYLRDCGYTTIPVVNEKGMYEGTVSEGDFLWYMIDNPDMDVNSIKVGKIVNTTRNPVITDMTDNITILNHIIKRNFVCLVDGRGCFIGIITRKSLLNSFNDKYGV